MLRAIGSRAEQLKSEKGLHRKVAVDLPLAAATAFRARLADKVPERCRFRFVFCSRQAVERSRGPLLLMSERRRCVGEVERGLSRVADEAHGDGFETYILRPASFGPWEGEGPAPPASVSRRLVGGLQGGIGAVEVARAMVHVACNGWKERIIEKEALVSISQG